MTTQNTVVNKYKCDMCKDTGWIQTENGCIRCKCYEKEKVNRLWKRYGVDPSDVKKLNEYKPYDEITKAALQKATEYVKHFDTISTQRENSFGLFGQPGSGKSHIAIAIGAALLNRDKPIQVIYMPYLEVMRQLKANANDDEYYLRFSSRYQQAKVLIIDDLFKDKIKNGQLIKDNYGYVKGLNEADMKHIYPILNYRYINKLPTLISTECTPQNLQNLDEALAGRILESCGDNITIFNGAKYNFRMRKFMKNDRGADK